MCIRQTHAPPALGLAYSFSKRLTKYNNPHCACVPRVNQANRNCDPYNYTVYNFYRHIHVHCKDMIGVRTRRTFSHLFSSNIKHSLCQLYPRFPAYIVHHPLQLAVIVQRYIHGVYMLKTACIQCSHFSGLGK